MIFVLVLLVSMQNFPTFAFLREYETMDECMKGLVAFSKSAPEEVKANAGCMQIAKPDTKSV